MRVSQEFSKYATQYGQFNQIQQLVAKRVIAPISLLTCKPKKILDLGCGSGAVYKTIDWELERFVGVDFSNTMLELHPKEKEIRCILGNFDEQSLFDTLQEEPFDALISASALQWTQDLEIIFKNIARLDIPVSLAIFTSGTFSTLNKVANLTPLTPSKEYISSLAQRYFGSKIEVVNYSLEFENTREMFQYIKKSGVSGGRNILSYKQTKKLMQEYPTKVLEFEVVYINSFSRV